jgi:hypothetical protein
MPHLPLLVSLATFPTERVAVPEGISKKLYHLNFSRKSNIYDD